MRVERLFEVQRSAASDYDFMVSFEREVRSVECPKCSTWSRSSHPTYPTLDLARYGLDDPQFFDPGPALSVDKYTELQALFEEKAPFSISVAPGLGFGPPEIEEFEGGATDFLVYWDVIFASLGAVSDMAGLGVRLPQGFPVRFTNGVDPGEYVHLVAPPTLCLTHRSFTGDERCDVCGRRLFKITRFEIDSAHSTMPADICYVANWRGLVVNERFVEATQTLGLTGADMHPVDVV